MERRTFLLGLLSVAGTAAFAGTLMSQAEATPLDQLRALSLKDGPVPDPALADDVAVLGEAERQGAGEIAGMAPDGTPVDNTYWVWRNGRRYWVQPRRRRRVCRRVWTSRGWRTQCWWR